MANFTTDEQMKQMCEKSRELGFRPERMRMLDERLAGWVGEITPSVMVRVMRHGQLAFEGAYGTKGPDRGPDSLTDDTIFPICSITKPVVGTLISIMQEEGLVDLNHPVRDHLPEFTGDEKGNVRIWHLLTHTSGIRLDLYGYFREYAANTLGLTLPDDDAPDGAWDEVYQNVREKTGLPYMEPGKAANRNTFLTVALSAPPAHPAHTVMAYDSFGYDLVVEIIRRISGKTIDEYASEKLFKPLGMSDTHFIFPCEKLDRFVQRAPQYIASDWLNGGVLNSEGGGGGLKSTMYDLTRFGQMYLNKGKLDGVRVLSAASVREITSDHNSRIPPSVWDGVTYDSTWGLGWNVKGIKKDDSGILKSAGSFDHSGFGCCKLLCDPEADLVAAYFTVCMTDCHWNASKFYNMVIGAIDD